jgi:hypothetical protein
VLYLASTNDTIIPLETITKALKVTPDGQLVTVKAGHFSVYSGVPFPYLVQHMVAFLRDKNGMKRMVMSSAEAAGLGRPQPPAEHKGPDPAARDEIREEREALVETAAVLCGGGGVWVWGWV